MTLPDHLGERAAESELAAVPRGRPADLPPPPAGRERIPVGYAPETVSPGLARIVVVAVTIAVALGVIATLLLATRP